MSGQSIVTFTGKGGETARKGYVDSDSRVILLIWVDLRGGVAHNGQVH
jgi:hypothetical protein